LWFSKIPGISHHTSYFTSMIVALAPIIYIFKIYYIPHSKTKIIESSNKRALDIFLCKTLKLSNFSEDAPTCPIRGWEAFMDLWSYKLNCHLVRGTFNGDLSAQRTNSFQEAAAVAICSCWSAIKDVYVCLVAVSTLELLLHRECN